MRRKTKRGRPAAAAALLVALVVAAGTGCRPVTVTGAGTGASATGGRQLPTAPVTPPRSHAKPPSPTHHGRTHRPVMAPGAYGGRVRELQARLTQLGVFGRSPTGYYGSVTTAAVRAFQRRQRLPRTGTVQPATWNALRSRTHQPSRDELRPPTSRPIVAPDRRCLKGRVICISKKSGTLAWMVNGTVVSAMDVRFGSQFTPTREGTFRITFKSRRHVSTIYHTAMPYAMFFSGGQAVHYSADFAARGYRGASHGCVNVRDKARIAALFGAVGKGTRVVVHH
ncbi:L,D-transpeptidase family protein [Streptomyces sp. NPDC048483]|uniref:L,D-transpeptidase family protein n=1 Tax=Streptomyces sp. NPDC048483 TaxID=3154927 RepID=UPI00343F48BE